MRVVLDTNTLVSGVISPTGPPRRLLDAVRSQSIERCSSATLSAELLDVLSRKKFAARLAQVGLTPQVIVVELRRLAYMATPQSVPRVIDQDPDNDEVLACAVAGRAELIISGDRDLNSLGGHYAGIPILTPTQAVREIEGL